MQNMSFALTTEQIDERVKWVTRRMGWRNLKKGQLIRACKKCMGFKAGETIEPLAILVVVDVRREPLNLMSLYGDYGNREAIAEGFYRLDGYKFVKMFCENMGCKDHDVVTRIEFRYVPGGRLNHGLASK